MARLILPVPLLLLSLLPAPALARETVSASAPQDLSVTVYRDPNRAENPLPATLSAASLNGFAMVSETRTVILPAGPSTIRFEGVAEGMVAVTAIVTGLPGGVIEKNRNGDLLSPAALVDGSLGNRVTISRTNPATGLAKSEDAIVRTRADGGLVLQTSEGFEAVRCAGLPEKLLFGRVPAGLSAAPVFSIDTNSAKGGSYRVTLTYLATGFDWRANYLATLEKGADPARRKLRLTAWLTIANDNGQSFPGATLLAVAGTINVERDFRSLSDPLEAKPLRLTCYPLGSTARVTKPEPVVASEFFDRRAQSDAADIVVTASRMRGIMAPASIAMKAREEALGDVKLYRVPEPVTVAARSLKQVAFLDRPKVDGTLLHRGACAPESDGGSEGQFSPVAVWLRTRNDAAHGLGVALPSGNVAVFEPSSAGELVLGEQSIRDYASGQKVEIALANSRNVYLTCGREGEDTNPTDGRWHRLHALVTNANTHAITIEIDLADSAVWAVRELSDRHSIVDGRHIMTVTLPANSRRALSWDIRNTE
ncbi:MAG: hypothetical protein JF608_11145 [Sphingomonadales bacterium]|nr:hypothetical protein [Sphingomonadales bacterium]